ncbi:hypothetical protein [Kaistella sp.]|uniref:hypothetical protein n=1 Tax=Kaistella sp. TaxID=2782235 RepID=UPI002F94B816
MYTQLRTAIIELPKAEKTIDLVTTDNKFAKIKNYVINIGDKYCIVTNIKLNLHGVNYFPSLGFNVKQVLDANGNEVKLNNNEKLALKDFLMGQIEFNIHTINKKVA